MLTHDTKPVITIVENINPSLRLPMRRSSFSGSKGMMARECSLVLLLALVPMSTGILTSSHVFSNHKGGCGKTTILFHTAGEYASKHRDQKVLVIDTTLRGDLSELLLGGDLSHAGKKAVQAVTAHRSTTKLFFDASSASASSQGKASGSQSALASVVGRLFVGGSGDGDAALDLEDNVVRCCDFNPSMPDNLYLCPGGSGPQTAYPSKKRGEVAEALRAALVESESKWKVMCDTDGDQGFSDYTKIAHALCDNCIIPLKTNVNDFSNRCVPMLEELWELKERGQARSRVQLIVWNEVDVQKNAPSPVSGLITPSKAAQGVIAMLNGLVADVASNYPDLFFNAAPEDREQIVDFCKASTMCMRDFGVTGMAAAEHGTPFVSMKAGKLEGGRLVYDIGGDVLSSAQVNVAELADVLDDPAWGRS